VIRNITLFFFLTSIFALSAVNGQGLPLPSVENAIALSRYEYLSTELPTQVLAFENGLAYFHTPKPFEGTHVQIVRTLHLMPGSPFWKILDHTDTAYYWDGQRINNVRFWNGQRTQYLWEGDRLLGAEISSGGKVVHDYSYSYQEGRLTAFSFEIKSGGEIRPGPSALLSYADGLLTEINYIYQGKPTIAIKMHYDDKGRILRAVDGEFTTYFFYEPLSEDVALETIAVSLATEYGSKK
jgi:hypothetical protein